jgi:hypothetical protein
VTIFFLNSNGVGRSAATSLLFQPIPLDPLTMPLGNVDHLLVREDVREILDTFEARYQITAAKAMKTERNTLLDEMWDEIQELFEEDEGCGFGRDTVLKVLNFHSSLLLRA